MARNSQAITTILPPPHNSLDAVYANADLPNNDFKRFLHLFSLSSSSLRRFLGRSSSTIILSYEDGDDDDDGDNYYWTIE